MKESKVISLEERAKDEAKSYLEELLSEGARKLLQTAIENEVAEYLEEHRERRIDAGQRAIVRNGHHPERELVTGVGAIKVRHPRIRHRDGQKFSSAIQRDFGAFLNWSIVQKETKTQILKPWTVKKF